MPIPKTLVQTKEIIRERIRKRKAGYLPGDKLPNYPEFAASIPTSVATLGRALRELRAEGIIVGVRGQGVWVAEEDSTASE